MTCQAHFLFKMIDPFAELLHVEPERESDDTLILGGGGQIAVQDVTDDDGESDDEPQDAEGGIVADQIQPVPKKGAANKRARLTTSSNACGPQPRHVKKRLREKRRPETACQLAVVAQTSGARISTLFLPQKKGEPEPVSLLPQYKPTWLKADFGERTFIITSTSQRWLQRLMHHAASKGEKKTDSRTSLVQLCAVIKTQFSQALNNARKRIRAQSRLAHAKVDLKEACVDDSDDSSSESEDDSQQTISDVAGEMDEHVFRKDRWATPVLQVQLGGIEVMCINTKKRIIFAVDAAIIRLIETWLIPLAQRMARGLVMNYRGKYMNPNKRQASDVQEDSQGSEELSRCLKPNATPNLPQKVIWKPTGDFWKVTAQNLDKDTSLKAIFEVDSDLKGAAYLRKKVEMYIAAVNEWNEKDRSKRHRIAFPYIADDWLKKSLSEGSPPSPDM